MGHRGQIYVFVFLLEICFESLLLLSDVNEDDYCHIDAHDLDFLAEELEALIVFQSTLVRNI